MNWKLPPRIKILEALGCIGDGRMEVSNAGATVTSSSGNKKYAVRYDAALNAISSNDNASYWQGYLGYPAIAYLLAAEKIPYDKKFASALAGIKWKDINSQMGNNFA